MSWGCGWEQGSPPTAMEHCAGRAGTGGGREESWGGGREGGRGGGREER